MNKQKPATTQKRAKNKALSEFRKKHYKELDKNIATWIEIRDNQTNSPKDRNEAAKNIQRSLGAMSPEKEVTKKQTPKNEADVFSAKRKKQITDGINKVLRDLNQEET